MRDEAHQPAGETQRTEISGEFQLAVNHKAIAAKLAEIEAWVGAHDEQFAAVIEALRRLTAPDGPRHRRRIGFGMPGRRIR